MTEEITIKLKLKLDPKERADVQRRLAAASFQGVLLADLVTAFRERLIQEALDAHVVSIELDEIK